MDVNIQVSQNDVLVTKDGTIGKVALVPELGKPATLNSGVFVFRTNNRLLPTFLFRVLSSSVFREFIDTLSAGSTIKHLYQKDLKNFEFEIPVDKKEQEAIADTLTAMDEEVEALEIAVGAAAGVVFPRRFVEIGIGKIRGLGGRVPGIRVVEVLDHGGMVQFLRHGAVLYGLPAVFVIIAVPFIVIEVALVIIGPVVDAVVAPGGGFGGLTVPVDQALGKVLCPQRTGIGLGQQVMLCQGRMP